MLTDGQQHRCIGEARDTNAEKEVSGGERNGVRRDERVGAEQRAGYQVG